MEVKKASSTRGNFGEVFPAMQSGRSSEQALSLSRRRQHEKMASGRFMIIIFSGDFLKRQICKVVVRKNPHPPFKSFLTFILLHTHWKYVDQRNVNDGN